MDNKINRAQKLDKVRAAAIFNTKKRFAEMEAKKTEKKELQEIAEGLSEDRREKSKPKSSKKGE